MEIILLCMIRRCRYCFLICRDRSKGKYFLVRRKASWISPARRRRHRSQFRVVAVGYMAVRLRLRVVLASLFVPITRRQLAARTSWTDLGVEDVIRRRRRLLGSGSGVVASRISTLDRDAGVRVR